MFWTELLYQKNVILRIVVASKICQLRKSWSKARFWRVDHLVKDSNQFLGCPQSFIIWTISNCLSTHKLKVWNKFLNTLSIGASKTSTVINIKSCLEHMLSMLSFHVLHLPSCKHEAWQSHIQGVAKDWRQNFVPGVLQKIVIACMKILTGRLFS